MSDTYQFNDTTLLITHYNRSELLERLLNSLRKLKCKFDDIVVSDDGSSEEHSARTDILRQQYNFRLITAPVNKGLGNCLNKGQDAVKTPYTLYIQEDFEPADRFPVGLSDALSIMNECPDIDYIRFWSLYRFPTLTPFGKGFSETKYTPWTFNHLNFFMYSDNPHLRRSNFLQKFGRYDEHVDADKAEHKMSIRFIQKKGRGLFYEDHTALFKHIGFEASTMQRARWRQSRNPLFMAARALYLKYKCLRCIYQVKFT